VGGALRAANYYAVADGNGNVALLVDADSAAGAVETTEHEPFGRVVARHRADAGALPAGAGSLCPFGFSSKYLDPETGLQYFGYRYFSPDLGRWLCRDPLGEKGGANLYAYCQNDPVNAVDPLGLRLCTSVSIVGYLQKRVPGLSESAKGRSSEAYVYTCGPPGWAGDSEAEIVRAMVSSQRTFFIAGSDETAVISNLEAHVGARMKFVELCRAKRYDIGDTHWAYRGEEGQLLDRADFDRGRDPGAFFGAVNNEGTAMWCRPATSLTFAAATGDWWCAVQKLSGRDRLRWDNQDWIPGDWARVGNSTFKDKLWAVGSEGENIVYTGNGRFWGHLGPQVEENTLDAWSHVVSGFRSLDGKKHGVPILDEEVRFPLVGLRMMRGTVKEAVRP